MLSGSTKTMATKKPVGVRLERRLAALACAVSYAVISSSVPAFAQVPPPVNVASAVNTNQTLTGTYNGYINAGASSPGYFVSSGNTLTVNNALIENFVTTGGSGSGGGLGAGGAIFIDTGGTVTINNTTLAHNSAVGGTGGTSSPYGGNLNNIGTVTTPDATPNGMNGVNGTLYPDNEYIFGDGKGNGVPGIGVTNGGNAINGVGGIGGIGGPGGNGWVSNPVAQANNDIAIANIAAAALTETGTAAIITTFVVGAIGEIASGANPFSDPLAPITGISSGLLAVVTGINAAAATIALVDAIASQKLTQGALDSYNALVAAGLAGNGGNGQNGGNGGAGSYGYGGGAGGQGGAYGLAGTAQAVDGTGGNGGVGGAGGFGSGGGAGGAGFGACQNGISPYSTKGCTSSSGTGGAGGAAGFGGGVGSTGGVTGVSLATGGGGGDGYGGAIFVNNGGTLTITGTTTFTGDTAIGGASLNGGLAGGTAGTDLFLMTGATVNLAAGAGNVITFNGTIADNSSASIGAASTSQVANYPTSAGASLTVYNGLTVFNGKNTYSGQTVINGGSMSGTLNPGTNSSGAPNYALTDGALQANDGKGLPTASTLNFSGPGQFTGGVLQVSNGTFTRYVSNTPNPDGGINPGSVEWTGSGGFAAITTPLTVTLDSGSQLTWGTGAFVPYGSSLIFGSANSNQMTTFTNPIYTDGTIVAGTAASFLVAANGIAAGSVATLSGAISGTGDVSIGGGGFNGTLIMSGANTYTGATVINSGALALSGAGTIASSSGLTLSNTGILDISQTTAGATVPTLNGAGNVFLGNQELTVANGGTFSGVIADGGVNNKTGGSLIIAGGTETLTGINTYTGDTTINALATLALKGNGAIANSKPVIVNGTLDISQTTSGAAITSLQGSGQVLIGQNLLMITNASTTFAGDINDGGLGGGTGGNVLITGGTQTLTGTNTYTGLTIIDPGATLALKTAGSIASSSGVDALGTFDISQQSNGATIATLFGNGIVAIGNQKLTIANGSTAFDGSITDGGIASAGTGGQLEIAGGTQTLTGTNTYTGNTTIDPSATLALAGTGSISTSADVVANGTFDISQTSAGAAIITLSGANTGSVKLGSQLLLITGGSTTFAGVISDGGIGSGTGGMLAIGGGTQTLSGINTYTGGTLIESGATLALSGAGSIAKSAFVDALGTFDISQINTNTSIVTLLGTGNVALGSKGLTITNGASTFDGVIADGGIGHGTAGTLTVSGGTQTLSGTNTYTGATTIAPNPTNGTATLALIGTGSIATSSQVAIATGGTFDISQTSAGASIVTLADSGATPSGKVALGSQTLTITQGSTTFSGVIGDGGIGGGIGGNFTVTGGTQTLAGVNTYTGQTTISPATTTAKLALTGAGSIATSSEVLVNTNGTFDISGVTSVVSGTAVGTKITTLSGSGSTVLGSNLLVITNGGAGPAGANPAGIFTGVISGLGGLAIVGGEEELRGANSYSGGTLVTNGATVSVNSSQSLGTAASTLSLNNGTVILDNTLTIPQPVALLGTAPSTNTFNLNSFDLTLSGAITGPGVLTATNGGTLNLTGTVSGIAGIVLGPGTNLMANAQANMGLATTPIIVTPPANSGGTPTQVFTGSVHVVGPLDITNGATPELIILPGDTLVGVGQVNITTVVQGGGTNAPGDGPGTIFHNFSVTDLPNSTFNIDIDGTAQGCTAPAGCSGYYSQTIVTGTNTYTADGTIAPNLRNIGAPATNSYTPPVTTSFTVLTAGGGILGTFAGLTQPTSGLAAGTRFDALYISSAGINSQNAVTYSQNSAGNPDTLQLWVTPSNYQDLSAFNVSLSQNGNQVAYALNALRGQAGLKNNAQATWDFGQLYQQQPQNLPGVFKTLNGEVVTDLKQGAVQMTSQFLELMLSPSIAGRSSGIGGGPIGFAAEDPNRMVADEHQQFSSDQSSVESQQLADARLAYAAVMKQPIKPVVSFDQRWTSWATAFGGAVNASGNAGVGSTDVAARAYGYGGGMDYHLGNSVFGFAMAGGGTSWTMSQSLGTGRSDVFMAGAYGVSHFGPAYLAGALSFANHWASTDRLTYDSDHLKASFGAQSYGARLEFGYRYDTAIVGIAPYLAAEYQRFATPNYSETDVSGGGFALSYKNATVTDYRGELGARFDKAFNLSDGMPLIVRGRAAYAYNAVSDPGVLATFEAANAPGALSGANVGFNVTGAPLPKSVLIGSAGTELRVGDRWTAISKFEGQFASGAQVYSASGTLRYTW